MPGSEDIPHEPTQPITDVPSGADGAWDQERWTANIMQKYVHIPRARASPIMLESAMSSAISFTWSGQPQSVPASQTLVNERRMTAIVGDEQR